MGSNCNDSEQEHRQVAPSRREALISAAAMVVTPLLGGVTSSVQAAQAANTVFPVGSAGHGQAGKVRDAGEEWLNYAGDKASAKYSPPDQISEANVNRLKAVWTCRAVDSS